MSAPPRPGTPVEPKELSVRLLQDSNKGSASPVTNELLIAARKGYSKELERILEEKGATVAASTVDRVSICVSSVEFTFSYTHKCI